MASSDPIPTDDAKFITQVKAYSLLTVLLAMVRQIADLLCRQLATETEYGAFLPPIWALTSTFIACGAGLTSWSTSLIFLLMSARSRWRALTTRSAKVAGLCLLGSTPVMLWLNPVPSYLLGGFLVCLAMPFGYAAYASHVARRESAVTLWGLALFLTSVSFLYSLWNPSITLSYAGPRDAFGLSRYSLAFCFPGIALAAQALSHRRVPFFLQHWLAGAVGICALLTGAWRS